MKKLIFLAMLFLPISVFAQSANLPYSVTGISPSGQNITVPVGANRVGISSGSGGGITLKTAAGVLFSAYVTTGGTAGYLMIFNAASNPSNGAVTAGLASGNLIDCVYAPAMSTTSLNYINTPEAYTVGITAMFSTTGCGTLTASNAAFIHGSAQ
jgi:hypothetical protein